MKKKYLAGVVTGLVAFGMAETASANLITNGSFESGHFIADANSVMVLPAGATQIAGWTVVNHKVGWMNNSNPWGPTGSDGLFFLDLTEYPANFLYGGVSQTAVTTLGNRYALSFDLGTYQSNPFTSGPISVVASAGGISQSFLFNPTGSGVQWQTFSLDFIADSANTKVSIVGTGTPYGHYLGLDNVRLNEVSQPVPEPSTAPLLGMGMAGLAVIGLRRKKESRGTAV